MVVGVARRRLHWVKLFSTSLSVPLSRSLLLSLSLLFRSVNVRSRSLVSGNDLTQQTKSSSRAKQRGEMRRGGATSPPPGSKQPQRVSLSPPFFLFFSFPNLPLIPRAFSRGTALILARCYFNVMQIGKATSGKRLVVLTESLLWGETCLALVFNRFRYVPAYRAEETATEINILREICIWYYVTVVYWAWL